MLKALRLSGEQRRLVLTHLETKGNAKDTLNLQRITVNLFGAYNFGAKTTSPHGCGSE